MKKKWIYLDDVRIPNDSIWTLVKSYDEFVAEINLVGLDQIEFISLDHDLGDSAMTEYYTNTKPHFKLDYNNIKEKTGYDCAKWLVQESIDKDIPLPTVKVHSANPIGASNIMGYVNNYLKIKGLPQTCTRVEFPHTYSEIMSLEERVEKYKNK